MHFSISQLNAVPINLCGLGFYQLVIYFVLTDILLLNVSSARPGVVTPRTVEIAIGGSANITCSIKPAYAKHNSSYMYFQSVDEEQLRVPDSDIAIIDNTTIMYMLRNASAQGRIYNCFCGDDVVNKVYVSVGTKPLDVVDFKCRSYDYVYMECTFGKPHNNILTQYELTYTVNNPNYIQMCELLIEETHNLCNLTDGNYRNTYEYFNFTLVAKNALGSNVEHFRVNNFQSVIPARPEFNLSELTNSSVKLEWTMPNSIYYEINEKGLQYELHLCPERLKCTIKKYKKFRNLSTLEVQLPYAYYWYTAELRLSASTLNTLWSEPFQRRFQSKPAIPPAPPVMPEGGFYIGASETTVRLYWQQLPFHLLNGPDFRYIVEQVNRDGHAITLSPLENDSLSPTFPWEEGHVYEFKIKSRNAVGESLESSRLVVPTMQRARQITPLQLRNSYSARNRSYTISWSPPPDVEHLVNYTVFWCVSKIANSNECKEPIQFKHVKSTLNYFSIESQKEQNLNFAISANYLHDNSGMHWITCSADEASDLVRMEPTAFSPKAGVIKLQWSTDGVCSSLLEGYILTYCAVEDEMPQQCASNEQLITVKIEKTAKQYFIRDAEAFTTYKFQMLMYSKLKRGPISVARLVRTREEAPTPPQALIYHNVTSNSALISWQTPTKFNGHIKYYTIVQNNEHHIINCTSSNSCPKEPGHAMQFKLENLGSYTRYKVHVLAHTVASSQASNDIEFQTLVGRPSNPRHITFNEQNHNLLWSGPEVPSGRVEFYEVSLTTWNEDEVISRRISVVFATTNCTINTPSCRNANYRHTLQVRAVNVAARVNEIDMQLFNASSGIAVHAESDTANGLRHAEYGGNEDMRCVAAGTLTDVEEADLLRLYSDSSRFVLYRSEWEEKPFYNCLNAATWHYWLIVLLTISMTALLLGMLRFGYVKYIKMINIQCALPAGLTAIPYLQPHGGMTDFAIAKVAQSDALLWHEQNHLLANRGVDYFGNGMPSSLSSKSSSDTPHNDYVNSYSLQRPEVPVVAKKLPQKDAYYEMNVSPYKSAAMHNNIDAVQLPPGNGYVPVGMAKETAVTDKGLLTANPGSNGYIKPLTTLMNWQTTANANASVQAGVNDASYVTAKSLTKIKPLQNDYTTVGELKKSNKNLPTQCLNTSPTVPHTSLVSDSTGGCGAALSRRLPVSDYVTPPELSVFGQSRIS